MRTIWGRHNGRQAQAGTALSAAGPPQELTAGGKARHQADLPPLARAMATAGLLSLEQAQAVDEAARKESLSFGALVARESLITARRLADFIALTFDIPSMDLRSEVMDPEAIALVDEGTARQYTCIPIRRQGQALTVAMVDPSDFRTIQVLMVKSGRAINPVVATWEDIHEQIDISYRLIGRAVEGPSRHALYADAAGRSLESLHEAAPAAIIDRVLSQAVLDRASDVHFSVAAGRLRVRFRIDGILHDVIGLSEELHPAIISRLKIISGLNIAERRRPQDGQFIAAVNGREVDVRVAISSTIEGEMAVLRLLDKNFTLLGLDQVGMAETHLLEYRRWLRLPYGMVVVCGPTGAGKSTTLYASILEINRTERHVVSLEDPVEYQIPDSNQMQVHPEAGVTFAAQLRSILRLDPDIILVGEVRDQETAAIAAQAALTGHLVLTSLHANDTVSALVRLRDLQLPPYLIASSVAGIVAQRMVRVVCRNCREQTARPLVEQEAYAEELEEHRSEFVYGAGCNACAHTGYHGRTGVFELLSLSDGIRQLFLADASREDLMAQALKEGMVPLRKDAMLKVRDEVTTPYEVLRTLFSPSDQGARQ